MAVAPLVRPARAPRPDDRAPARGGHHRPDWHAHDRGDLLVGHSLDLAQDEHLAKIGRQLLERVAHSRNGVLLQKPRFRITFQTPVTYSYHRSIHPGMVGTVIVNN
jgi:hypothetical protein